MNQKRRLTTAYHEAGHAVAAFELGVPFREVSIAPSTDSWGHVLHVPVRLSEQDVCAMSPRKRDRLERHIVIGLAGREGGWLVSRRYDHRGALDDYRKALKLVLHIVSSNDEAQPYFRWLEIRARHLVQATHRRPMIDALAMALMEQGTITGRAAFELMLKAGKPTR